MLTLYVDRERWYSHLRTVVATHPGIVPVTKGNGYGLGSGRLAAVAQGLGADTVAVGTYAEVVDVEDAFEGSILVLSPWRDFETRTTYGPRIVHTVGRLQDLEALATASRASQAETAADGETRPRVVLELMTSMRRHGFTARGLREAAGHLDSVSVEGFALHLPMSHRSHLPEVERLMTELVASGIDSRRVYVSHLTDAELASLARSFSDFELRPRIGTALWLGARDALAVRATVLDVHEVARGDEFGYRGRSAPGAGAVVVVSGGTAHGIGLEAPTAAASVRDRAARFARGGLDAAGLVRSPFTIAGKRRLFGEPPHMQVSMLFLPRSVTPPTVGTEVDVRVRHTISTFDRTLFV